MTTKAFLPALFFLLPSLLHAQTAPTPTPTPTSPPPHTHIHDLLKPHLQLKEFTISAPSTIQHTISSQGKISLTGQLQNKSATIMLTPPQGTWDISNYAFFRVDITNRSTGLIWIRGRLDNADPDDWKNSSSSMAYILPGERATLGFPFQRIESQDDAPDIFYPMGARPNGYRHHWLQFDPKKVLSCRLSIRSTSDQINLQDIEVSLAQPFGSKANAHLLELPYLDAFGQVRQLNWPNKLHSEEELPARAKKELADSATSTGPSSFNAFGGWNAGPQLKATGYFRLEKYKGRWWFVDPTGRLFFSHGANSVGFDQRTTLKDRESLFSWLPSQTDPSEALINGNIRYTRANLQRTFGPNWKEPAYSRIHTRMRQWGMNTVGAWSDPHLYKNPKTPYTAILHVWRGDQPLGKGLPDPFSPDFEKRLEEGLRHLLRPIGSNPSTQDPTTPDPNISDPNISDPWCLGVFIDNELGWYEDFITNALAGSPNMPARKAVIAFLQNKYPTIESLNAAWQTQHTSWDTLNAAPKDTPAAKEDRKSLERLIANRYYKLCHDMMRKVLPNHLYLGSRIHKASPEVYEEAVKYVDVLSINRYMSLPATSLHKGVDKPCLIAEFHFGAPDRGVPGVGLMFVGDQLQRSRAYAAYVLDAVNQPNIVGTHWFAYPDQSAAARPTAGKPGENYQIGFVDVTDTPYPEITAYSRSLADVMYSIAERDSVDLLQLLQETWKTIPPQ